MGTKWNLRHLADATTVRYLVCIVREPRVVLRALREALNADFLEVALAQGLVAQH